MVPEDVATVTELDRVTEGAAHWTEGDYSRAATPGSGIKGWVAEVEEKVIAFLIARTTFGEMEILNLAVSGIYRRCGIATKLLAERLGTLEHSSTKVAFLEVRESNAAARSFYAKTGFRETGRRPKYYTYPTEDAVVLRRDFVQPR
jgi:[ribosomal protein S18]-alanine N-acetyltransferase